jgi:hypothetical protein
LNELSTITTVEALPAILAHASARLDEARSSAEILDARDMAKFAYDAAKSAAGIARAKGAHDDLVSASHRLQGDALKIEARAKYRLAEEYDAAQERGEVAGKVVAEAISLETFQTRMFPPYPPSKTSPA